MRLQLACVYTLHVFYHFVLCYVDYHLILTKAKREGLALGLVKHLAVRLELAGVLELRST